MFFFFSFYACFIHLQHLSFFCYSHLIRYKTLIRACVNFKVRRQFLLYQNAFFGSNKMILVFYFKLSTTSSLCVCLFASQKMRFHPLASRCNKIIGWSSYKMSCICVDVKNRNGKVLLVDDDGTKYR